MNLKTEIKLIFKIFLLLIVVVFLATYFRVTNKEEFSLEPVTFTQCLLDFNINSEKVNLSLYYKDEEKECYGQRYTMPSVYYSRGNGSTEKNQKITMHLVYPELTSWYLASDEIKKYKNKRKTVIRIGNQGYETMSERSANNLQIMTSKANGYHEVVSELEGVKKYSSQVHVHGDYYYSSGLPNDFFMRCAAPFISTQGNYVDDLGCTIYTHIDNRLRVEYNFRRKDLTNLIEFHNRVINLITSFFVN